MLTTGTSLERGMNGGWTLDCADIHTLAAAWLDEQLSAAERELFEAHLDHCRSCETFVGRLSEQSIIPPVIELSRAQDYWADMDAALVVELDRLESSREQQIETRASANQLLLFALAAALLLCFVWGWGQQSKAVELEYRVQQQAKTIKYFEQLATEAEKHHSMPSRAPAVQTTKYVPARLDL